MPPRAFQKIRPEDHTILLHINNGTDDVRQLNKATTLSQRQINYAFSKLEELGFINVDKPDGYTTEFIQGQKHTFRTPKNAALTERGEQYLEWTDWALNPDADIHSDNGIDSLEERLTALEKKVDRLAGTVNRIENQLNQLQRWVKTFRKEFETVRTIVTEHLPGLDASDAE